MAKNSNETYKPATLFSGKGPWYVYFHVKHPDTGQWVMIKDRDGLNYKELRASPKQRMIAGHVKVKAYNERLEAGWTPFGEERKEAEGYDELKFKPAGDVLTALLNKKQPAQKNKEPSKAPAKKGERIKPRTWQSYKYSLDVFKKWLVKSKRDNLLIAGITPLHMTMFFDALSEMYYKNKSINNHKGNLNVLFKMAVKRELIVKSPLADYEPLPVESGKNFPFSEKQKQDLKKKILATDPSLWLFVKFIYHLFIRPIENLRIRIIDVDLRTSQVIIHSDRGKNKTQLAVQIPDSFIDEIKAMKLEQYPPEWYLFGKARIPHTSSFTIGPSEFPYSRNAITKRHSEIMKACKITNPDQSMYGWKHTGNVDAYRAGVSLYNISRQNRHHSIEQTMTYLRSLGLDPNLDFGTKAPKL